MAVYSNPSHDDGLEQLEFCRELDDNEKSMLDMETLSDDSSSQDRVNVFVVFVFILELLVLIFVIVLEYFLRFTDVFPVRLVDFGCYDPSLSFSKENSTYEDFAYYADVPFEVIISLSFCLPPFIILIAETALWAFTDDHQKTVRVLCRACKVPQVVRRIIRFIGAFLFGMFVTMIFTDVMKIMVGRLRPTFLEICQPDFIKCRPHNDDDICIERDRKVLRDARLSFPSLHASMTAFAAGYLAIYLHNVIRAHGVRIIRPFVSLGFILLSVLCSLARYGLHKNHWEDILVGFLLGITLAIYVGVFALNNFKEHMSSHKLYARLRRFLAEQRALEVRDLYKETEFPLY